MLKIIITMPLAILALVVISGDGLARSNVRHELEPIVTIGDQELVCHRPKDLVVLPDQRIAVLNQGSCDVVCFTPDWEEQMRFGRCGEGPGELSGASGMDFRSNEYFVFRNLRVDRFDIKGEFLGTYAMSKGGLFQPIWWQGQFVGRSSVDVGTVSAWDPETEEVRVIGQDWGMCWVTLWSGNRILIADMITGKLRVVEADWSLGDQWNLDVVPGEISSENYAKYYKPTLGGVWWDSDIGLLVAVRSDIESEERPVLRWYSGDGRDDFDLLLFPHDLIPSQLVIGAGKRLFVLSSDESLIYEFRLPKFGG